MTFIRTILKPNMWIRQNYSSPTLTLMHMKLGPKIFTKISIPNNHPSGIKTGRNSKVLKMFKDEAGGNQIV